MITTPIVFVLGAGASSEFGFPTGYELLRELVNFAEKTQQRKLLRDHTEFSDDLVNSFREALDYSADNSVDAFLERNESFMELGKAMMAIALIEHEDTAAIFKQDQPGRNWMRYIFQRMAGSAFEEFAQNKVTFLTFNFDRSLEHFFCVALQKAWGKSEVEASAAVKAVPIVHLHGQLGYLPWQSSTNTRPFDAKIDKAVLDVCIREIKVIHEGVEERAEQFALARKSLAEATRIYFLGVGFGNVNLERLAVMEMSDGKAWSTERGLTEVEFAATQARLGQKISLTRHYECRQLISNFVDWS